MSFTRQGKGSSFSPEPSYLSIGTPGATRADFEDAVERARVGERIVERWVKSRGFGVIASYDFTGSNGDKAPKLMFESHGLTVPDLDCMENGKRQWLEVKTYYSSAPNYRYDAEVHGIESRLWDQYARVEEASGCPVVIAVLEVLSGCLLMSRMLRLTPTWPCQCPGCSFQSRCRVTNGIKNGVYWPRHRMKVKARFSDAEMEYLRSIWPTPDRHKPPQGTLPF